MPTPISRRAALAAALLLATPAAATAQDDARQLGPVASEGMEPGMDIGTDPQLTRALARLDIAQQDMARLEEVLRGAEPVDPNTQPIRTDRGEYAQEVIGQAMRALEAIEHTRTVPDDLDAVRDTRDALVSALRALASDEFHSATQVAQARLAMDTLENRILDAVDAPKGADVATD